MADDVDAFFEKKASEDDVDDFFAKKANRNTATTSPAEARLRGAAQGVSLGLADELGAAVQPVTDRIFTANRPLINSLLKLAGEEPLENAPMPQSYEGARDYERARNKLAKKEHPKNYLAGELAGGMIPATAAGPSIVGAAGYGGLSGLGQSEGKTAGQVAVDTLAGAGVGAGTHGFLSLVGKGGKKLLEKAVKAESGIAQAGANKALKETLSARSLAGRTKQEAIRSLEKINEYKHTDPALYDKLKTSGLIDKLEEDVFKRSAKQLPGEMAEAEQAAKAFAGAAADEPQRAAQYIEAGLGPRAAFTPLGRALKRYGLRAGTGAALGYLGSSALGVDPRAGAGLGALGLNVALAPTVMKNAWNPAMKELVYRNSGELASALSGASPTLKAKLMAGLLRSGSSKISPELRLALSSAIAEDEQ